jgi:hypothetical protein
LKIGRDACIAEEERKKQREEKEEEEGRKGERERANGDRGEMLVFLIF